MTEKMVRRLKEYDEAKYISDVENFGLMNTWDCICKFVIKYRDSVPEFLDVDNYSQLYELGLSVQNKKLKKKSGQYSTPYDVASILSQWLLKCKGENVCDVGVGTGNLIFSYLDLLGVKKAKELISQGKVYIYDFDIIALNICLTKFAVKYGQDIADCVNVVARDFLDSSVTLPKNSKVISNPPYSKISTAKGTWADSEVIKSTKEKYSAFAEKIFCQAESAVIITPYSFISGNKFYGLRKIMCEKGNGFIVSFDNIPGNIFRGKKHGVFNTNTANSVRAAITVFRKSKKKGFRISPLIRFRNEEREMILNCKLLEATLSDIKQTVDVNNRCFRKIDKRLTNVYNVWESSSAFRVKDLITKPESGYLIDMPNTCRYYTTACSRKLNRGGSITIYVDDKDVFYFLYCLINSSFAYWWWRIYDGGITYSVGLFKEMPAPFNLLTEDDKAFFREIAEKMISKQDDYVVTKMNAGKLQENIKFPEEYRKAINTKLLRILKCGDNPDIFEPIHNNRFFIQEGENGTKQ